MIKIFLNGKIEAKNMSHKLFKNIVHGNKQNTCIGIECHNQDELDELLKILNINKDILAEHILLKKSVYFEIIIRENGYFQLIY